MALKPPVEVPQGAIRLNTDSQKLEFYAQDQWWEMATEVAAPIGNRAVFCGGYASGAPAPKVTNTINYLSMTTGGLAVDFGDAVAANQDKAMLASRTRALILDGSSNAIDYITIATAGNAIAFGQSIHHNQNRSNGLSSQVRGVFAGEQNAPTGSNAVDYSTIASLGNTIDFGDLTAECMSPGTGASPTRGIITNITPSGYNGNIINYITIATTGNAVDFGDTVNTSYTYRTAGSSNSIRMIDVGGGSPYISMEFITIPTLGNGTDFGDLSGTVSSAAGASSSIRAVMAGGNDPNTNIDEVMFASLGNGVKFGDLTYVENRHGGGTSNCHGGI